jgi:hypothetical protein
MNTGMQMAVQPHVQTLKEDTIALERKIFDGKMTTGELDHALNRIQERIFYIREICNS